MFVNDLAFFSLMFYYKYSIYTALSIQISKIVGNKKFKFIESNQFKDLDFIWLKPDTN